MKRNSVGITVKKELRGIVRDKKSLIMMLVTPIMIPVMILLFSFVYDTLIYKKPAEPTAKEKVGFNYEMDDIEKQIVGELDFEPVYYASEDELVSAYNGDNIVAYVIKDGTNYKIFINDMSEKSAKAGSNVAAYLKAYNDCQAQAYLEYIGADPNMVFNNLSYETEKLPGTSDLVTIIIMLGFTFAIMAITLTAIYGATDSTAGEKERGTLETLLTFPIKSEHLVIGKYLAITVSCLITSVLCTALVGVSLAVASSVFEMYKNAVINIGAVNILLGLLIMFAYSLFISGLCIAIATRAKSFKEAQTALTPVCFIAVVPMFLDILKIALSPVLSLIPVISHTLLLESVFCGSSPVSVVNMLIMLATSIAYAVGIIFYITKQYKSEKILFS